MKGSTVERPHRYRASLSRGEIRDVLFLLKTSNVQLSCYYFAVAIVYAAVQVDFQLCTRAN